MSKGSLSPEAGQPQRGYNLGDQLVVPVLDEATKRAARLTVVERVSDPAEALEVLQALGLVES